jgi:hypothetical protein
MPASGNLRLGDLRTARCISFTTSSIRLLPLRHSRSVRNQIKVAPLRQGDQDGS